MSRHIRIWYNPCDVSKQYVHVRIILVQICKIHGNLKQNPWLYPLECQSKWQPIKTTHMCSFHWNGEITLHARIFSGLLRRRIILHNIPVSHHSVNIKISHRFHLRIKQNGIYTKAAHNENWMSVLFNSLNLICEFACARFHPFYSVS